MKKKNLIVFGTRPEAIKMATLVKEFQKYTDEFETVEIPHHKVVLDFCGIIK